MQLAEKTERGWLVRCDCAHGTQFTVGSLGIAVECPRCGRTALSGDLSADYWSRKAPRPRGHRGFAGLADWAGSPAAAFGG